MTSPPSPCTPQGATIVRGLAPLHLFAAAAWGGPKENP
jgi:hypothetical protein